VVETASRVPAHLWPVRQYAHPDMTSIMDVIDHLEEPPVVATAFLADPAGHLIAVFPPTPAIVGQDLSYLDWYGGTMSARRTYVSSAYQSPVSGRPLVVAVATPIRESINGSEQIVAILGSDYDLSSIQGFVDRSAG